jgi:hypothetical protein
MPLNTYQKSESHCISQEKRNFAAFSSSSHDYRLQPVDICFLKALSTYFHKAYDKWVRSNPEQIISKFQINQILGDAYRSAASVETAINGFAGSGI